MIKNLLTNKKFISILAAGCIFCSGMFAASNQLRDYIGIVKQQNSEETVSKLKEIGNYFQKRGYPRHSNYIDSYLENGTFGSGFVYVSPNGTNYVITNRHVVGFDTASIEFEDAETGKIIKYDGLTIFATDDEIDVTILKFPDGVKPFTRGLILSKADYSDGTEVYSAGFPGLGDKPVWQLGKGIITNSYARIPELLDPSISTIIQHSAEVDGGNSGGPLLIKNNSSAAGYDVIGINTWKASSRQGANYSIPIKLIIDLISKKEKTSGKTETAALTVEKFFNEINKIKPDTDKLSQFISYKAALENGCDSFIDKMRFGQTSIMESALRAFYRSPADGFRYTIACDLINKYGREEETDDKLVLTSTKETAGKNGFVFMDAKYGSEEITVVLYPENGIYHIYTIDTAEKISKENFGEDTKVQEEKSKDDTKSANKGSNVIIDSPTFFDLSLGCTMQPTDGTVPMGIIFKADVWFNYVGFSANYRNLITSPQFTNLITFNVGGRVPICFNDSFALVPFAKTGLGGMYFVNNMGFCFEAEAGLDCIFGISNQYKPGIGVSFQYLLQLFDDETIHNDASKKNISTFSVYGKLCF